MSEELLRIDDLHVAFSTLCGFAQPGVNVAVMTAVARSSTLAVCGVTPLTRMLQIPGS